MSVALSGDFRYRIDSKLVEPWFGKPPTTLYLNPGPEVYHFGGIHLASSLANFPEFSKLS